MEHRLRPDRLYHRGGVQHPAHKAAGLQLCEQRQLHRGHHLHVRQPDRQPELRGGADHCVRGGAGGGGAVQPDQRQPCRAQKGACHYQGSGLL